MLDVQKTLGVGVCVLLLAGLDGYAGDGQASARDSKAWVRSFPIEGKELVTTGENPYFILNPGYQLTFSSGESGKPATLVITVLDETKIVGGVTTRVVEERETKGGNLIEVSRNFFAIDAQTKDVYYFGEDVDMYEHGKVVSHDGAWQHGLHGAKLGLMMPGKPTVGARFYQEQAEGVAMDRVEVVSVNERVTTRAGSFDRCLKAKETTPLEPLTREFKLYAPGVGLIKDGDLELVSHGYARP